MAYSHDNVKAFSHMFSDYLNVQSLLWLSNAAAYSKDVSLLNIDSFRMQQYYGDEPNEYFSYYTKTFRRILKAKDFGTAKVCFKNLIMQPKPEIQFTRDGWRNDLRCSLIGPSSIYQRWNLQMRDNFGLLSQSALQTNEIFTILLVTKASKLGSRKQTKERKKKKNKEKSSNFLSERATRSLSNLESSVDKSPSAKGIGNSDELMIMLKELTGEFSARKHDVTFQIVKQDLDLLAFDDQVALIARSSLIIGMHGTGIAISMHMAVGSTYCCGVIEIFPIENDEKVRGIGGREGSDRDNVSSTSRKLLGKESKGDLNFISLKGHGNMARRMGHKYSRIDLKSVEADGVVLRATNGVSEGRRKHSASYVNGTLSDHSRQKKHKSRDVLLDSSREDANSKTSSRSAMRRLDPKVGAIEMTDGIRKKSSLASSRSTGGGGTYVPPTILRQSVSLMIESILIKPSCFLPAVIKKNI